MASSEIAGVDARDTQAILHLKSAIAEGKHWYVALLEAIRLWHSPEEDYEGRHYRYLIDREAFDLVTLAERLCEEVDGLIPEKELIDLLFFDLAPVELSRGEFKNHIGVSKHRTYLTHFYGVLVERYLILAVVGDIRKERRVSGLSNDNGVIDEAHRRIYGAAQSVLLKQFRKERHYPDLKSMSLDQFDEFTYWLFKYRIRVSDKSCVASDTEKALTKLHEMSGLRTKALGSDME